MENLVHLSVDTIVPNKWNCNYMSEKELEELKQAIQYNGVEPIIVRPLTDGKYEIVDGEHRFRAVKELGQKHIPAVIMKIDDEEAKIRTIVYNSKRGKIDYVKLSSIILEEFRKGFSQEHISKKYLISTDEVKQLLSLEQLSDETKNYIQNTIREQNTNITLQHLTLIANAPKEHQLTIAKTTINYQLSIPELKNYIKYLPTREERNPTTETIKTEEKTQNIEEKREDKHEIHEEEIKKRKEVEEQLKKLLNKQKTTPIKEKWKCDCGREYIVNYNKRRVDKVIGTQQENVGTITEEKGECPNCHTKFIINYEERKIIFLSE
jgi:ParB family chromosome partitioning protein